MRDPVWLVGVSMTPFGRFPERDLLDLASDAALGAVADAHMRMTEPICNQPSGQAPRRERPAVCTRSRFEAIHYRQATLAIEPVAQ